MGCDSSPSLLFLRQIKKNTSPPTAAAAATEPPTIPANAPVDKPVLGFPSSLFLSSVADVAVAVTVRVTAAVSLARVVAGVVVDETAAALTNSSWVIVMGVFESVHAVFMVW